MHNVDYMAVADKAMAQIRKGAFLTVQSGDALNVMTIGWASIGFLWGRPMFTIMVRNSRYTYRIIEKSSEFTVSIPMTDMAKQLEYCGINSGKSQDKFKECALEIFPGQKVRTPVLSIPGIHFECKIIYKSAINSDDLIDSYKNLYPKRDYHTIYYGEIAYCYSTVDEKG
ncbi:MAG TPA: flavin reductase family protein [Chitinispirillaceae bacterium]|nr:flavin reductase family protein [Chitinispirillaceae bacterium]